MKPPGSRPGVSNLATTPAKNPMMIDRAGAGHHTEHGPGVPGPCGSGGDRLASGRGCNRREPDGAAVRQCWRAHRGALPRRARLGGVGAGAQASRREPDDFVGSGSPSGRRRVQPFLPVVPRDVAGLKLFVDYSGKRVSVADPLTGDCAWPRSSWPSPASRGAPWGILLSCYFLGLAGSGAPRLHRYPRRQPAGAPDRADRARRVICSMPAEAVTGSTTADQPVKITVQRY